MSGDDPNFFQPHSFSPSVTAGRFFFLLWRRHVAHLLRR
ncbi:hypothetical protein M6B38_106460 [Iris pallida]|uniref:Uncharacterized protein n=1 Tax=Iris pallida TaxID=29817 RepID=A0AAX6ESH2_IRIPA|nr:hypothetical protein M6B38_106460 [Iris pallida]